MTISATGRIDTILSTPLINSNSINELVSHPAFHSVATEEDAAKVLQGTVPMTYILWTEESTIDGELVHQHFLSYMNTDLKVEHRTFSRPSDWFYQNLDPHHAKDLADLIPKMMHCKPHECRMLVNHHIHA